MTLRRGQVSMKRSAGIVITTFCVTHFVRVLAISLSSFSTYDDVLD
jgi:hypothetical protein